MDSRSDRGKIRSRSDKSEIGSVTVRDTVSKIKEVSPQSYHKMNGKDWSTIFFLIDWSSYYFLGEQQTDLTWKNEETKKSIEVSNVVPRNVVPKDGSDLFRVTSPENNTWSRFDHIIQRKGDFIKRFQAREPIKQLFSYICITTNLLQSSIFSGSNVNRWTIPLPSLGPISLEDSVRTFVETSSPSQENVNSFYHSLSRKELKKKVLRRRIL